MEQEYLRLKEELKSYEVNVFLKESEGIKAQLKLVKEHDLLVRLAQRLLGRLLLFFQAQEKHSPEKAGGREAESGPCE